MSQLRPGPVTTALIYASAAGGFLTVAFLIVLPPWQFSFAIAASGAATWCRWLEHVERRDASARRVMD
jgi:hypothetical protein